MRDSGVIETGKASDWEALGLAAYDGLIGRLEGFRAREGQRAMAQEVARTLARGELGEVAGDPDCAIAVVQAGTGVGKSAAYISAGAAIAKARGTRLVISTSTVALQSQLLEKDLPALAAVAPVRFTFALAKGRGRYVCQDKLLRHALIETGTQDLLDFGDDPPAPTPSGDAHEARVRFYRGLADAVAAGWDGDRDTLPAPPPPEDWAPVAAERHTCTVKACAHFDECAYYRARRKLADADVIVANHDLLLASMNARVLPELSDSLLVIDEAHHLPRKAVEQFAASMDLSRLRWLDKAPRALAGVAAELEVTLTQPVEPAARELRTALTELARVLVEHLGRDEPVPTGARRLDEAEVQELLREPLRQVAAHAATLMNAANALATELRSRMRDNPGATRLTAMFAALGGFAPHLTATREAAEGLLAEGDAARRTAKWCSVDTDGSFLGIKLHACPILPGDLLRQNLWSRVRSAVLTSATITSCGSFGFFLSEAGLSRDPAVTSLAVKSPFDYARQGRIVVRQTRASPKDLAAFNAEVVALLVREIEALQGGGLALFTSRRHLDQAVEALGERLRDRVLVQGARPRGALVAEHARRVRAGQPSALLGLASFGEGLDLPGDLCRELWITKLPFASPDDPVGEARADYVEANGGNAFSDLVVPETGVRLLQWTGRGIRTETDTARITIFDRRITEQAYGRRILAGLPPYPVEVVPAG
ncbi:ATP-dependent DNA helicase DinG [Ramlibacter sp. MAHUQ-53]|uniref:ATP-dependent DNA helicase DinG n=1 Tax=unclassified Ramlibacter TaxID=2617605 RepID=UPI0036399FF6